MPMSKSQDHSDATGRVRFRTLLTLSLFTLAVIVCAGVAGFLFRQSIADGANQVREQVLSAVGFGLVPATAWAVAFTLTLAFRRSWLLAANLWLSAAFIVVGTIGALAFFRPLDGALGWFSMYGFYSLGGSVGDAIIGSQSPLGVLRLSAIFIVAAAVALPIVAFDLARITAQGLMIAYLAAFMGIRSLLSRSPAPQLDETPNYEAPTTTWTDSESGGTYSRGTQRRESRETVEPSRRWNPTLPEVSSFLDSSNGRPVDLEDETGIEDTPAPAFATSTASIVDYDELTDDNEDDAPPFEPDPGTTPVVQPKGDWPEIGPKSNRYWSPSASAARAAPPAVEERPGSSAVARPIYPANGSGLLWQRPALDLFIEAPEMPISEEEQRATSHTITQTLGDYGVEVQVGHVRPGPTVTMYGLVPGWVRRNRVVKELDDNGQPVRDESGRQVTRREEHKTRVKVDTILAREKDLALALKTPAIRIETPAMGKSLVGIEVPNPNPSLVTLRNVMTSNEFQKMRKDAHLPVALGRGSGGEAVCFDLAKMPHLLVAGATGSGKSVCLNAIVSCLITEKTPNEMRMLLVDPKRVELTPYNGVPHLMAPVIVETDTVVGYLKGLIREMFKRYRMMEEVGVRNIEAYNKRTPDNMPYLCVVVDELADLMMTAAFDVEQSICRLAQLGRATGIHLIIATQRPSVDVVTGLIKANFPSRISFGVTSQVDSRTILDTAGADKLLGRGDMLYLPLDASKPSRVQSVFIGDNEIGDLVNFWQETPWPPIREIDLLGGEDLVDEDEVRAADEPDRDDMFNKAIELAQTHRKLSTSLLQRRLRIGYPRAARLMDQLEDEGVVGPGDGSKSRDVIINQA